MFYLSRDEGLVLIIEPCVSYRFLALFTNHILHTLLVSLQNLVQDNRLQKRFRLSRLSAAEKLAILYSYYDLEMLTIKQTTCGVMKNAILFSFNRGSTSIGDLYHNVFHLIINISNRHGGD